MYSIVGFGEMLADTTRIEAYAAALKDTVGPESVVLDIGAGTGVMTLLACRFGARHVFAVEPSEAIALAREAVRANGFADRVTFFQALTTDIELPERTDIAVADIRGVLPAFQGSLATLIDARRRLLRPGGRLIPQSDRLWVAVLEDADRFRGHVGIWESRPHDVDLGLGAPYAANLWAKARVGPEQLLSDAQRCAALDYDTVKEPNIAGAATLTTARDGVGHGLLVWFDAHLTEDISYSNAPARPAVPQPIYGQAYFPWPEAVPLARGDTIEVQLRADLIGNDYTWSWNSLSFRQSAFFGEPLASDTLRKMADRHVPTLAEEGSVDLFVLQRMNGDQSVGEIATALQAAFPERFRDTRAALTRVGLLSKQYSR